jgi:hypothetical protein
MVRRLLLCVPLLLLADRIGAAEPPAGLVAAVAKGRALRGEKRVTVLGHLAWAAVVAGQPELARALAKEVGAEPEATTVGLAWSAAALSRLGAGDEAVARFRLALACTSKTEFRLTVLPGWFAAWCAAGEGGAPPDLGRAELGQAWVDEASRRLSDPEGVVESLAEVAPSLRGAGLEERALALARAHPGLAPWQVKSSATLLSALGERGLAREHLARAVRDEPDRIDARFAEPLVAAWRGEPAAGKALEALATDLVGKAPLAGRTVRLAQVVLAVEGKALDRGALLRAALDDAWAHEQAAPRDDPDRTGPVERAELVVGLVQCAPGALSERDALALLKAELCRAKERERSTDLLATYLEAQAEAAGRVGGAGALDLLRRLAEEAEELAASARAAGLPPSGPVYSVAAACAEAAARHGGERATEIVDAVVRRCAAAIEGLTPAQRDARVSQVPAPHDAPTVALFRCAKAAVALGQLDLAALAIDAGLAHLDEGHRTPVPYNLALALEGVAAAPEPRRGELVGRIVARFELCRRESESALSSMYSALAPAVAAPR